MIYSLIWDCMSWICNGEICNGGICFSVEKYLYMDLLVSFLSPSSHYDWEGGCQGYFWEGSPGESGTSNCASTETQKLRSGLLSVRFGGLAASQKLGICNFAWLRIAEWTLTGYQTSSEFLMTRAKLISWNISIKRREKISPDIGDNKSNKGCFAPHLDETVDNILEQWKFSMNMFSSIYFSKTWNHIYIKY